MLIKNSLSEGIETRFVTIERGDYICTAVDETLGICLFDTENTMQRNPSKCKATVFGNSRSDPNSVWNCKTLLGVTVNATTSVLDA